MPLSECRRTIWSTGRLLLKKFVNDRCTTLALLPVFMIWIYTCWVIVLAGMEFVWYLHIKTAAMIQPGRGPEEDAGRQMPAQQGIPRD